MKTYTLEEWRSKAIEIFEIDNFTRWKFVCPNCGHIQCAQDFIDAEIDQWRDVFFFSCIGRWKKGVGCDWTLGGLLQIHQTEVISESGEKVPVFEFAQQK